MGQNIFAWPSPWPLPLPTLRHNISNVFDQLDSPNQIFFEQRKKNDKSFHSFRYNEPFCNAYLTHNIQLAVCFIFVFVSLFRNFNNKIIFDLVQNRQNH